MSKRNRVTLVLVLVIVVLLVLAYVLGHGVRTNNYANRGQMNSKDLPTLYMHGIHDSSNDMNSLTTVAQRNGGTGHLNVNINKNGKASYHGHLTADDSQPIIKINVSKSQTSINQQVTWISNVLKYLHQKYNYRHYNTVGLSSAAVVFYRVAAVNSSNRDLPQPKRMVSIGAPFNGVLRMDDRANKNKLSTNGKPLIMKSANQFYPGYKQLIKDSKCLSENIQFLNIYGNLKNKTNSDGVVTTTSAESLRYLVTHKRDTYYQRLEVEGHDASHQNLANTQVVQRATNRFLFDTF